MVHALAGWRRGECRAPTWSENNTLLGRCLVKARHVRSEIESVSRIFVPRSADQAARAKLGYQLFGDRIAILEPRVVAHAQTVTSSHRTDHQHAGLRER